jgi:hypothetical protein
MEDIMVTDTRLLAEGYGPGAWHGPDLKAALDGVTAEVAFWRPAAGRHNIAENALHHAFCTRAVLVQVSGVEAVPFVLPGDDWFALSDEGTLAWKVVKDTVATQHDRLTTAIADIDAGRAKSPIPETERANLTLGIACHAIYHAGQIQLIKRLREV